MEIGKALNDAWDIYLKNFAVIFIAFLIMLILGALTLGLLFVPLMVGTQMLFVKAKRGEALSIGSIFSPIKRFFALFFGAIWFFILYFVGIILGGVPGLIFAIWWMFSLLSIYDKNLGIGAGMRQSKSIVMSSDTKNSFLAHIGLLVLAWMVGALFHPVFAVGFGIGALMLGASYIGKISLSYAAVLFALFALGAYLNSSALLLLAPALILLAMLFFLPLSFGVIACGYAEEAK